MKFESETHEKAYNRVNKMIKDLYQGEDATFSTDRPHWCVMAGSGRVHISVLNWQKAINIVVVTAYIAQGTEVTPSCMEYLLVENHTMVFGGFALDSDGDIAFNHSLIADTCSKEELRIVVDALRSTADGFDDKIVARWGGKRAMD